MATPQRSVPVSDSMDYSTSGKRPRDDDPSSSSPPRHRQATHQPGETMASLSLPLAEILEAAFSEGSPTARFIVRAVEGKIPCRLPHVLKKDILDSLPSAAALSGLRYTRNGCLILSTSSKACALAIAAIEKIGSCPVRPDVFMDSISRRGVIGGLSPDIPVSEILHELNEPRVTASHVRRLQSLREGTRMPSSAVVCTFLGPVLPEKVFLWFEAHRVRVYEDRPQTCTQCLSYGHVAKYCRGAVKCNLCGNTHSEESTCTPALTCLHCGDDKHKIFQRVCPRYTAELEILRAKSAWGCSYQEARDRLKSQPKKPTFATVMAGGSASSPPPPLTIETIKEVVKSAVDSAMSSFFREFRVFFQELWMSTVAAHPSITTPTRPEESSPVSDTSSREEIPPAASTPESSRRSTDRRARSPRRSRSTIRRPALVDAPTSPPLPAAPDTGPRRGRSRKGGGPPSDSGQTF